MATLTDAVSDYRHRRESSLRGKVLQIADGLGALLLMFDYFRDDKTPADAWRKMYSNSYDECFLIWQYAAVDIDPPPPHNNRDLESLQSLQNWASVLLKSIEHKPRFPFVNSLHSDSRLILDYLSVQRDPVKMVQIMRGCDRGRDRKTIKKYIDPLIKAGLVRRGDDGRFSITQEGRGQAREQMGISATQQASIAGKVSATFPR